MEKMMQCPSCGGEHPVGTTYCSVFHEDLTNIEEAINRESEGSPCEFGSSDEEVEYGDLCPSCGYHEWRPEELCPACMSPAVMRIYLQFSSGRKVYIPRNQFITIGRESEVSAIRDELRYFDTISRQHCQISLSLDQNEMTIRDLGSTNHTWLGDGERELLYDEEKTASLPVDIHLGRHPRFTITVGLEQA